MGIKIENPGALAGATGADVEVGTLRDYGKTSPQAIRFQSAARMFRITLTLSANRFTADGRMEAWEDFANVINARLTERERALLAYWSARTLSPSVRFQIATGRPAELDDA